MLKFVLIAAAAAAGIPAQLAAQETTRPRTGPEAAPPALPDYPEPRPLPPLTADPGARPTSADATGVEVRSVRIEAEGDGRNAAPPPAWEPPTDPASGLVLEHDRGGPFDADWVRRQFAHNRIEGGGVDRALALVQLINRAFLTAGFVNSGLVVPVQDPASPVVLTLRLIHGRLAAPAQGGDPVAIVWGEGGAKGLDEDFLRARMPSARHIPVSAFAIERDFRLLAEHPAIRTVNATLRPGARPGEASLQLVVHPQDRGDLYVTAGNSRSPSVGGERVAAGGHVRNLVAAGDLLSGEFGLTEGLKDSSVAYAAPLFTPRTTLTLRASLNEAAVVDLPLVPLDIRTRDKAAEAGLLHRFLEEPLTPGAEAGQWSPSRTFAAGILFAYRHQRSFLFGEPFSFAPGSVGGRTEYGAARLVADYLVRNVDQVFAASATLTVGLGGTRPVEPDIPSPDRHFKALLVQLNFARRLDSAGLELRARLTGQIADGILYSGERISAGGEASVRGYRENLLLADQGLIGSVELARPFSLSRQRSDRAFDWGAFTAAAFADAALVRNADPPHPADGEIYSVGVSLAWTPSPALSARVAYGLALADAVQTGSNDLQDEGFHFRITVYPLRLF